MTAGTTTVFTFCINAPVYCICVLAVIEARSMRLYGHSYGFRWVNMLLSSNKQTNQVTAWSRVILGKLIEPLLVKKFPFCYGTQRFITIFTTALPCCILHIQNDIHEVRAFSSNFFNLHFNIIIPFIHRFYKLSLFFRFSNQISLCSSLFLCMCHMSCSSHPPSLDHPKSGAVYKFLSSSLCNFI